MTIGDKLNLCVLAIYVVAACCFASDRDWPRFLYFVGAAIIAVSISLMK